ncbi:hypothetical protein [Roseomonas fluvialis]|uniref:Uncharacterized protein n=1 Tax=Roseomonas fluvialis TaxID=1750527 RepID=A0ABN6P910_9PROT|nr:hypothetical protein [Roseomonas fluvialis]BDG73883.1 hypothetical protein Rmf_38120 [Roseomonas fluvialis]
MACDALIPAVAPAKHVNHAPADEEPKHVARFFGDGRPPAPPAA